MRILRRILLGIFILVTLSQWCLGVRFAAKAPTTPDYQRGAIYPVRIHQSVVYITSAESYCYNDWIFIIGWLCGAPVIFYEVLAQRKRSKKPRGEGIPPERLEL